MPKPKAKKRVKRYELGTGFAFIGGHGYSFSLESLSTLRFKRIKGRACRGKRGTLVFEVDE